MNKTTGERAKIHWLYQLHLGLSDEKIKGLEERIEEALHSFALSEAKEILEALDCMVDLPDDFVCKSAKHKCNEALRTFKERNKLT